MSLERPAAVLLTALLAACGGRERTDGGMVSDGECRVLSLEERDTQSSERVLGAEAADGNLYAMFSSTRPDRFSGTATLIEWDASGALAREGALGNQLQLETGMHPLSDGSLVVALSDLQRVGPDGTIEWAYSVGLSLIAAAPVVTGGAWGVYQPREGVELGGETLPGGQGLVLVKVDASGAYRMHRVVPAASLGRPLRADGTSDGGLVVVGAFTGQLDLGTELHEAAETTDFVARFGPDGATVWSHILDETATPSTSGHAHALQVLPDDSVVYAHLRMVESRSRVVLLRLASDGTLLWEEPTTFDSNGRAALGAAPGERLLLFGADVQGEPTGRVEVYSHDGELLGTSVVCVPEPRMLPGGIAGTETHVLFAGEVRRPLDEPLDRVRDTHQDAFFGVAEWGELGL